MLSQDPGPEYILVLVSILHVVSFEESEYLRGYHRLACWGLWRVSHKGRGRHSTIKISDTQWRCGPTIWQLLTLCPSFLPRNECHLVNKSILAQSSRDEYFLLAAVEQEKEPDGDKLL